MSGLAGRPMEFGMEMQPVFKPRRQVEISLPYEAVHGTLLGEELPLTDDLNFVANSPASRNGQAEGVIPETGEHAIVTLGHRSLGRRILSRLTGGHASYPTTVERFGPTS